MQVGSTCPCYPCVSSTFPSPLYLPQNQTSRWNVPLYRSTLCNLCWVNSIILCVSPIALETMSVDRPLPHEFQGHRSWTRQASEPPHPLTTLNLGWYCLHSWYILLGGGRVGGGGFPLESISGTIYVIMYRIRIINNYFLTCTICAHVFYPSQGVNMSTQLNLHIRTYIGCCALESSGWL